MNKVWKIVAVYTMLVVSLNIGLTSSAYAASSENPQDQKTTIVETKLLRKISPNKFPVDKGTIVANFPVAESNINSKQLPKTGSDINFYEVLGVLLLLLIGVINRYSRIKEG